MAGLEYKTDLRRELVPNAICVPVEHGRKTDGSWWMRGAAYDSAGKRILFSTRLNSDVAFMGPDTIDMVELNHVYPGRSLFVGILHYHFGHFIVETLSRLWILEEESPESFDHFVFQSWGLTSRLLSIDHVVTALSALSIPLAKVVIVSAPCRFDELVVPEQSWTLRSPPTVSFRRTAAMIANRLAPNAHTTPKKIYLSRSRLGPELKRVTAEIAYENDHRANGFAVLHPEEMSFSEQVGIACHADEIAGFEGSALYLCVFSQQPRLKILSYRRISHYDDLSAIGVETDREIIPADAKGYLNIVDVNSFDNNPIVQDERERLRHLDLFCRSAQEKDKKALEKTYPQALSSAKFDAEYAYVIQQACAAFGRNVAEQLEAKSAFFGTQSLIALSEAMRAWSMPERAYKLLRHRVDILSKSSLGRTELVEATFAARIDDPQTDIWANELNEQNRYRPPLLR